MAKQMHVKEQGWLKEFKLLQGSEQVNFTIYDLLESYGLIVNSSFSSFSCCRTAVEGIYGKVATLRVGKLNLNHHWMGMKRTIDINDHDQILCLTMWALQWLQVTSGPPLRGLLKVETNNRKIQMKAVQNIEAPTTLIWIASLRPISQNDLDS